MMKYYVYILVLILFPQRYLFSQEIFDVQLDEANFEKIDSLHFHYRKSLDSTRYITINGQYKFERDTLYLSQINVEKEEFEWIISENKNPTIKVYADSIDLKIDLHLLLLDSSFIYLVSGYNIVLNGVFYKDPTDRFLVLKALKHQRNNLLIDDFPVSFEVKKDDSTEIFVDVYKMINNIKIDLVKINKNIICNGKVFIVLYQ